MKFLEGRDALPRADRTKKHELFSTYSHNNLCTKLRGQTFKNFIRLRYAVNGVKRPQKHVAPRILISRTKPYIYQAKLLPSKLPRRMRAPSGFSIFQMSRKLVEELFPRKRLTVNKEIFPHSKIKTFER